MAIKTELNTLLSKKMDRRDFLKHVAIGVVALTGLSAMLRALTPSSSSRRSVSAAPQGYGSSVYGGKKTS